MKNLNTVSNFKSKYHLYFLLVYPNIKNSTKNVYSKIRKYSSKSSLSFKRIEKKKSFIKVLLKSNNDLQSIVEMKYPIIGKLLKDIKLKKGCYFSRMTGSGSVCYGVFTSEKTAKAALVLVRSKYPKFWFSIAKTI